MQKLWNSPAPTLGLAMLASCLFMWGRNWHMYTWTSLGISLAMVVGVGLLLLAVFAWLDRVVSPPRPQWMALLLQLLTAVLLGGILVTLLALPIDQLYWSIQKLGFRLRHLIGLLALAIFLIVYVAKGYILFNTFFLSWLLISLCIGLFNIWSDPGVKNIDGVKNLNGVKTSDSGLMVELKKKPNIYLYFLESYHSPYAMELLYDHDVGPITGYLREKNFLVYDKVLSNSSSTLASMGDTFTMRSVSHLARGNDDVEQTVRRAIGGSNDNHLFKILKDNGYHTVFLTGGSLYFFQVQGPNLDTTDIKAGYYNLHNLLLPFLDLNKLMPRLSGTLPDRIRQAVKEGIHSDAPFLLCFKGYGGHTPFLEGVYQGTQEEFEDWKPVYMNNVTKADKEIKEIIEYLDEVDPEAIVILVGDHGANGYGSKFIITLHNLAEVEEALTQRDITLDSSVQDLFGTLLAIRLPGGDQQDISYGLALNHVNLFRHVFAYLNDDPTLLNTRVPAESHAGRFIVGRDNQPVLELR